MKTVVVMGLLLGIAFLVSCGGGPVDDYPITDKEFKKGTDGIHARFLSSAPPKEIFEGTTFEAGVEIHNKGGYSVTSTQNRKGYLTLSVENDYMTIPPDKQTREFELEGRRVGFPDGDKKIESFIVTAKNIDPQSEKHEVRLGATRCYQYETEFVENVCIATDIFRAYEGERVCEVKPITMRDQGAPVAATKIETNILPQGDDEFLVQFLIYIQNKGRGTTIRNDADTIKRYCTQEPVTFYDINVVELEELRFNIGDFNYEFLKDGSSAGRTVTCGSGSKRGTVRLDRSGNQEGDIIRCTTDQPIQGFTSGVITQLYARFGYGYSETEAVPVVIKRVIT